MWPPPCCVDTLLSLMLSPPICIVFPYTTLFRSTGAVTVEAWIKVAALTGNPQAIIERYGPSYSGSSGEDMPELESRMHQVCRLLHDKKKGGVLRDKEYTSEGGEHAAGVFDHHNS